MIPKFIVLLLSGGMDSTVLLYDLIAQGCRVFCVLFDYGQQHQTELNYAKRHCKRLNVEFVIICLPTLRGSKLTGGSGSYVVPNRNAIMLSMAVNVAVESKADIVAYACNQEDVADFPDCRPEFVESFNELLRKAEIKVEVCAPYARKMKWEIGDIGRQLGVNMDDTWSCYVGGSQPCGKCPACLKRQAALK